MLTPETISDDLDKYKENVSKVIDKARKNHDFALAVLEEKTLSELDLSKEEQVALFKACSLHRSREIQRRIILNQGLCEFATQHRLHAFFFPLPNNARGRLTIVRNQARESIAPLPIVNPSQPHPNILRGHLNRL